MLNMYANENGHRFPPIDNSTNNFMFESDTLYPEYLTDAAVVACPSDPDWDFEKNFRLTTDHPGGTLAGEVHPDCFTNMSYTYLGWMVMTEAEAAAFMYAYDESFPKGRDNDLIVPEGSGNAEGDTLHRLSQGVDRFLIPDTNIHFQGDDSAASVVPIIWDQVSTDIVEFSHVPAGQNVLYLDGHVDFYRYDLNSTQFPTSPLTGALFDGHPRKPIPDCDPSEAGLNDEIGN